MKHANLNRARALCLTVLLSTLFVVGCQSATGPGAEPEVIPSQGSEEKPTPDQRAVPPEAEAAAQAVDLSPEALAKRLAALGVEVLDHADGTYEYVLPDGLENEEHWEGPLKYRYMGQATLGIPHGGEKVTLEWPETEDPDSVTRLLNTIKVDNYGRRWEVVEVDEERLAERIEQYDAWATETFGEEGPEEEPGDVESDIEPGTLVDVWLLSNWATATQTVCSPTSTDVVYGQDDRQPFFEPTPSVRMDKMVTIWALFTDSTGTSRVGSCSGVMISDHSVLTAQHCISRLDLVEGSEQQVFTPSQNFVVCTRGNSDRYDVEDIECSTVEDTVINGNRLFTNNIKHDYAVIQLDRSIGRHRMGLSQRSVSHHQNFPAYTSGYPGVYPGGCTANGTFETAVDPLPAIRTLAPMPARQGFWQGQGTVMGGATTVRTTLDAVNGQSGSPIYYYPGGCPGNCGSNWVTGVLSHNNCKKGTSECYTGGPHVKKFRTWAIGVRQ